MGLRLSIVIPTYNRADVLSHTLRSLAAQTFPRDRFEVVVADDGSSDDTGEVVGAFRGRLNVRYTRLPRDEADVAAHGYCVSRVRNAGARLARAPVLVFLDSGVVAGPDLLAEHSAAHADAVGRAVMGYTFGTHKLRPFPGMAELMRARPPAEVAAAIGAGPRGLDVRHEELAGGADLAALVGPWILFWTLNASVTAADFWAVGGFDEDFRGWGYEDVELGYRLARHGVRLTGSRAAWALEWPGAPDLAGVARSAARNIEVFLAKHRHPAVEIYAAVRARNVLRQFERDHAALLAWAGVAERDVRPELASATAGSGAGRLCVLGCGESVPGGWPPAVLVDFDAEALGHAGARGGHATLHAVGLRTGLPDAAFDRVLVSSRLRGLWARFGDAILAEARRIGRRVDICFAAAEAAATGSGSVAS